MLRAHCRKFPKSHPLTKQDQLKVSGKRKGTARTGTRTRKREREREQRRRKKRERERERGKPKKP